MQGLKQTAKLTKLQSLSIDALPDELFMKSDINNDVNLIKQPNQREFINQKKGQERLQSPDQSKRDSDQKQNQQIEVSLSPKIQEVNAYCDQSNRCGVYHISERINFQEQLVIGSNENKKQSNFLSQIKKSKNMIQNQCYAQSQQYDLPAPNYQQYQELFQNYSLARINKKIETFESKDRFLSSLDINIYLQKIDKFIEEFGCLSWPVNLANDFVDFMELISKNIDIYRYQNQEILNRLINQFQLIFFHNKEIFEGLFPQFQFAITHISKTLNKKSIWHIFDQFYNNFKKQINCTTQEMRKLFIQRFADQNQMKVNQDDKKLLKSITSMAQNLGQLKKLSNDGLKNLISQNQHFGTRIEKLQNLKLYYSNQEQLQPADQQDQFSEFHNQAAIDYPIFGYHSM